MRKPLQKVLGYLFTALMPGLMGLSFFLDKYYVDHRPMQPDSAVGAVFARNVHGTTVYLTRGEYFAAVYLFFIGIACGIIGGAILQRLRTGSLKIGTP